MHVHGWAVDTTTILRVHVICAGSAPPFLVFTPDFSFLAMNLMPVIPRAFLLMIFIRPSQLFPYVTLPPDLTSSLLCIPNYDHVCVILDALRISYHASEVTDCFIDDGVINHVRRVIKQHVQVVQVNANKLLSVLDRRWPVCFDEDGPGKPLAPVNLRWIRVVDLVPEVVKRICD